MVPQNALGLHSFRANKRQLFVFANLASLNANLAFPCALLDFPYALPPTPLTALSAPTPPSPSAPRPHLARGFGGPFANTSLYDADSLKFALWLSKEEGGEEPPQ